ncbi:transcriptional regulator [Psychrosphaera saromensis]|nr:transcriptional regulator [Psychrosphaera saromensis]GLQ14999.1 transcriptional regulator [Psychrosphaera saromensis]
MGVSTMMGKSVSSEENNVLMAWLKAKRKEKGHTMRTLSLIIGTPHSFIGKVENQERRLDIVEYLRYCKALEVDPLEGLKLILN